MKPQELARILQHPEDPPPASTPGAPRHAAPQWLIDLFSGPPEPRDESGKIVPLHLRNAATAAWHLGEPFVLEEDPGALKRYLGEWLGWKEHEITRDHEHALYLEITEELERPISKKTSW